MAAPFSALQENSAPYFLAGGSKHVCALADIAPQKARMDYITHA
jgi:hypothetical protein